MVGSACFGERVVHSFCGALIFVLPHTHTHLVHPLGVRNLARLLVEGNVKVHAHENALVLEFHLVYPEARQLGHGAKAGLDGYGTNHTAEKRVKVKERAEEHRKRGKGNSGTSEEQPEGQ